jgi:integrase
VVLDDRQYRTAVKKRQRYQEQKKPLTNRDMKNNILTTFKRYLRWAGIKSDGNLSIHTLRKCCITNLANEINNPEVVMELAGHSDIKTTMQYHSKVTKEQRQKAAKAIDKLSEVSERASTKYI